MRISTIAKRVLRPTDDDLDIISSVAGLVGGFSSVLLSNHAADQSPGLATVLGTLAGFSAVIVGLCVKKQTGNNNNSGSRNQ